MARSLTPTEFVERPSAPSRHRREQRHALAAREALRRLTHTLRHPRLRQVGP